MDKKYLEEEIKRHQNLYYNETPEITDEEFDALWDTLKENYPDSVLLMGVGTESGVDAEKFPHEIHMGSQEKIRTKEELEKWLKNKNIQGSLLIEEKIDGISVEIIYDKGKPVMVLTRGNGSVGVDITRNIINIPDEVDTDERFSVRGEVVIFKKDFEKIVKEGEITNPRNVASGIANQKNSKDNIDKLKVIAFDTNKSGLKVEGDKTLWLSKNGFMVPKTSVVATSAIGLIMNIIDSYKEIDGREYAVDGVVLKHQTDIPDKIDKARPDHQRAFKWQAEQAITRIIGIEWSRSGNLYTPVALLEPVQVSGTMVSRASLANLNEIENLGLTIPSDVIVEKRGEIIPKVMGVYKKHDNSQMITPPTVCALCGGDLTVSGTKIACENLDCISVLEHRIYKWLETTGALGFGPGLVGYLVYEAGMTQIHQYYCEKEFVKALEGYNRKKAMQKSFAELWARRDMKLEDFVSGFDIDTIGSKIVKLIIDAGYDTLDALRKVKYDDLIKIDGIGEVRAKIFEDSMVSLADLMDAILDTNRISIIENKKEEKVGGNMEGKVFCITGKLSRPRADIETDIVKAGGKLASSVTKNTDYLVTNDTESGSSKNKKAQALGIKIINEEELLGLL